MCTAMTLETAQGGSVSGEDHGFFRHFGSEPLFCSKGVSVGESGCYAYGPESI